MYHSPLRGKVLEEILAIQLDEEALPTFITDWRPKCAEEDAPVSSSSIGEAIK